MNDVERDYLTHIWNLGRLCGKEEARLAAKRYAQLDRFRLSRMPELLEDAFKKVAA